MVEINEQIRRKVGFVEGTKDNPTFTPLAKPHSSALRKLWIERCHSAQYEELAKDLTKYNSMGLTSKRFFEKEGMALVSRALIAKADSQELYFICESIPKNLIEKVLSDKDFCLLQMFVLGTTEMENRGILDPEKLEERFKKIWLLIKVSDEVKKFLESQILLPNVGEGVKDHIAKALSMFESKCVF